MKRTLPAIALVALAGLLAIAGCGSSGTNYGSSSSSTSSESGSASNTESRPGYGAAGTAASESSGSGTVSTGSAAGVGTVLVDSNGMTLYYFEKDKKGGTSTCYGACASGWPPLTTSGQPKAMGGAQSSMLGTTKRSDGTTQVTYAGWPLYTYAGDASPGEDNGTDSKAFGASWYPLHPNGKKAGS